MTKTSEDYVLPESTMNIKKWEVIRDIGAT